VALNSSLLLLKQELGPSPAGRLVRCAAGNPEMSGSGTFRPIDQLEIGSAEWSEAVISSAVR
jgi:hypothetical protein